MEGPLTPDITFFGARYIEQQITFVGGATAGVCQLEYLAELTYALPAVPTAEQIRLALVDLDPMLATIQVTGTHPNFTITEGPYASVVGIIRGYGSFTNGTTPYIQTTVSEMAPLIWMNEKDSGSNPVTMGSASATLPRSNFGNLTERQTQARASEWFGGDDWLGGFGTRKLEETGVINVYLEGQLQTHFGRAAIKPPAVESHIVTSALQNDAARTFDYVGRTVAGGVRHIFVNDVAGDNLSAHPGYFEASTSTETHLPTSGSTWTANVGYLPVICYGGYALIGWSESGHYGYLTWDGGTNAANVIREDISITDPLKRVIAWERWNEQLWRLTADGVISFTAVVPPASGAWSALSESGDATTGWETKATYRGPGYAYSLIVYEGPRGSCVHLVATDGIYMLDFGTGILELRLSFNGSGPVRNNEWPQSNSVRIHDNNIVFTIGGVPVKYDGKNVQRLSWNDRDGVPENGVAFDRPLYVRSLTSMNYFLVANCTNAPPLASTATSVGNDDAVVDLISAPTTYYVELQLEGVGADDEYQAEADVSIENVAMDFACLLIHNGQGWHPLVPIYTGSPYGSASSIYHELLSPYRICFSPGKYIRFRDDPRDPRTWGDATFDTATRTVVTGAFSRGVQDAHKLAVACRIGYEDCDDNNLIKPYFQINRLLDTTQTGQDPTARWVQLLRRDGTALNVGAGDDPPNGVVVGYYQRTQEPFSYSEGLPFYELMQRFDLTSSATTITPALLFFSVIHGVKFNELFSFNLLFDISQVSRDGRPPEVQYRDAEQLKRQHALQPLSWHSHDWFSVEVQALSYPRLGTGAHPTRGGDARTLAQFTVAEFTGASER